MSELHTHEIKDLGFLVPTVSKKAHVMPLRRPTADTREIVQAALRGIRAIYKPGFRMAKAGVMLLDLHSAAI